MVLWQGSWEVGGIRELVVVWWCGHESNGVAAARTFHSFAPPLPSLALTRTPPAHDGRGQVDRCRPRPMAMYVCPNIYRLIILLLILRWNASLIRNLCGCAAFNLEGKRNQWDAQVSAITHSREESVSSRKRLAETTKGSINSLTLSPHVT